MKRLVCDCVHFDGSNCVGQATVCVNGKYFCALCADVVEHDSYDDEQDLKLNDFLLQEKLKEEQDGK